MEKLSSQATGEPLEPSLDRLHEMLRRQESDETAEEQKIELLQASIRELLPNVDTGKALPHKKTPSSRTRVLQINYKRNKENQPGEMDIAHLQFFARTAIQLGLHLEIWTNEQSQEDVRQELGKAEYSALSYTIKERQNPISKWAEDSVEYLENGRAAVLHTFTHSLLEWAMNAGRQDRWQGKVSQETLEEALRDDSLWIPLGVTVNADKIALEQQQTGPQVVQEVGHIRAYIEGGNMITGEDAIGEPVILIGKDAIDTTAYLYQLSTDEVKRIICEDFGLEGIDRILAVEQPGQFHLDMGLLFLGNGVVVVNDSSEALKDAIECAELVPCMTTETMASQCKLQYELEMAAAQDMEKAGLEVRRAKLAEKTHYNFFNGEFVVGNDGLNYYITNGGPADQEARFEALMVKDWQAVKKVIFSPRSAAQKSLQDRGGVGCRIKGKPA